jgi:divalent metal cation (Fe/Co/Zn/Cd) transporter
MDTGSQQRLWTWALALALITVFYNLFEGLISVYLGVEDGSLTLFGFGIDSFVEVISGIGIWHLVVRSKKSISEARNSFEKTALRITGYSFYALVIGLLVTIAYNTLTRRYPESTFWGVVISCISIVTMVILLTLKLKVGRKLNSNAIIADAMCTKTCIYLSVILLLASALYQFFNIGYIDSLGSLGIAYYSYKEGKEAFEKSRKETRKREQRSPVETDQLPTI